MKKLQLIIFLLVAVNASLYAQIRQSEVERDTIVMEEVETLAEEERDGDCFISGGPGSVSCSMGGGAGSIDGDCEVSCDSSHYACCGLGCHCKPYSH